MSFSCLTCFGDKYFNDHSFCAYCAKECHVNHKIFYLGEKSSVCNCFLLGTCKNTFDEDFCTAKIIEGEKLQHIFL